MRNFESIFASVLTAPENVAMRGRTSQRKSILTPGQEALVDVQEGMADAVEHMGSGGGRGGGMGATVGKQAPVKPDRTAILSNVGQQMSQIAAKRDDWVTPAPMQMFANPARERAIAQALDLPAYEDGGTIRRGQAGVVGDEIVIPDEEGAQVIPAKDVEPYGIQQTMRDPSMLTGSVENPQNIDDELTVAYSQANEAAKVQPGSKWKNIGFGILQGLDNYLNRKDQPIKSWDEFKRDKRVGAIAPQIAILEKQKANTQKSKMEALDLAKAQADTYKARIQAVQQNNPKLWEAIERKGYVDKADQKAMAEAGYGYIPEGDWRQFDTTYDAQGNLVASPKTGTPNYKPTGINDPKQGTDYYKGRPMKPSEAGRLEVDESQFNATKTQDADKFNADKALEVAKTNVANQMKYADDVKQIILKAAEVNGAIFTANPGVKGHADAMAMIAGRMQEASDSGDTEAFDKLQKEFNAEQKSFNETLGKVQGGKELLGQLKSAMPKRPDIVTFTPIKASTTGSKPVPKGKDPLGLFR